jgi:hypothetical protein
MADGLNGFIRMIERLKEARLREAKAKVKSSSPAPEPSIPAVTKGTRRRVATATAVLVGVSILAVATYSIGSKRVKGGQPEGTSDIKNVREVAKLRSAELLQKAQNTHANLREVMKSKPVEKIWTKMNDFNNSLTALWIKMASYGLGRDPYLDIVRLDDSGFSRAELPPDFGTATRYVGMGLPRLYDHFLELSDANGDAAQRMSADFKKLVQPYSNPEVYTHRAFSHRAYVEYRVGKSLFTDRYLADLQNLDQWLTDLETVLGKVPGYFEMAP